MSEVDMKKVLVDLKTLIDDAEGLVKATADQAGERVSELRKRLAGRVEKGNAALAQREKDWREQAQQAKDRVVTLLRDEHWDRVAICAGIGVLLGLAVRCRTRRSLRSEQ